MDPTAKWSARRPNTKPHPIKRRIISKSQRPNVSTANEQPTEFRLSKSPDRTVAMFYTTPDSRPSRWLPASALDDRPVSIRIFSSFWIRPIERRFEMTDYFSFFCFAVSSYF